MSNEKESKKSALIWVLIGAIILSVVVVLYVTFPNDFRVVRQLESRGFIIGYEGLFDPISQHPAWYIWKQPTIVQVIDKNVTPDDSRLICQLSKLQGLRFDRCDISGLNWDEIGHCRELGGIIIVEVTGFSISEIQKLAACPIEHLALWKVQLKDSDLENIMGLKQLEKLWLYDNIGITDASFEYLEKIATLKELYLTDTSVTEEGIKEFKKKRPDVVVYSDFGDFP